MRFYGKRSGSATTPHMFRQGWKGTKPIETVGTITDNWKHDDSEARTVGYHPWVRFTTLSGDVKHVMMLDGELTARTVGSTVTVLYDPNNPDDAHVKGARRPLRGPFRLAVAVLLVVCMFAIVTAEDWLMHDKLVSDRGYMIQLLRTCSEQIRSTSRSAVRIVEARTLNESLRKNVAALRVSYCPRWRNRYWLPARASVYVYGASFHQVCEISGYLSRCTESLDWHTRQGWQLPDDFEPNFDAVLRKLQIPENLIPFKVE